MRLQDVLCGRAPHGARGLKFWCVDDDLIFCQSRPTRGAWIEIVSYEENNEVLWSRPTRGAWIEIGSGFSRKNQPAMSRPTRGAWIEMRVRSSVDRTQSPSRPTRGAWIEIFAVMPLLIIAFVAPHTGRVD